MLTDVTPPTLTVEGVNYILPVTHLVQSASNCKRQYRSHRNRHAGTKWNRVHAVNLPGRQAIYEGKVLTTLCGQRETVEDDFSGLTCRPVESIRELADVSCDRCLKIIVKDVPATVFQSS